jgi:hypothetical protein
VTAGFDKVGEGLTLSSTHFATYQIAAEKALADAIYHAGSEFLAGRAAYSSKEKRRLCRLRELVGRHPFCPDLATVLSLHGHHRAMGAVSGRYRIHITAQARNNGGRSMPIAIGVHSHHASRPDAPELLDMRDVPETEMRTVTMEADLQREEQIMSSGPRSLSVIT